MGLGKVGSIIIIVLASVSISSLSQAAVQDLGIIELGTLNLGDLTNTIRQLNHQESLSGYTAFTAGYLRHHYNDTGEFCGGHTFWYRTTLSGRYSAS